MNPFPPTRLVATLALLPILAAPALFAQTTPPAAKLGSTVFHWDKLPARPNNFGERRNVVDQPTATLEGLESHITTLRPGLASHAPHRHAREEFLLIKEGTVEASINGKLTRVGPGSLLFYAANDLHNVRNVGDTLATYFVFNVSTAATKSAPPQGVTDAALPGVLASRVFDWEKFEVTPTKVGLRRAIIDSPTATCAKLSAHVSTVNAGEASHAPHRHADEEIVVLKEGTLEVTINGVAQRAEAGAILFFASNDEHGMKNVGTTPATYHVFRVVTDLTPAVKK